MKDYRPHIAVIDAMKKLPPEDLLQVILLRLEAYAVEPCSCGKESCPNAKLRRLLDAAAELSRAIQEESAVVGVTRVVTRKDLT